MAQPIENSRTGFDARRRYCLAGRALDSMPAAVFLAAHGTADAAVALHFAGGVRCRVLDADDARRLLVTIVFKTRHFCAAPFSIFATHSRRRRCRRRARISFSASTMTALVTMRLSGREIGSGEASSRRDDYYIQPVIATLANIATGPARRHAIFAALPL